MYYLLRIMTPQINGPCFRNCVIYSRDLPTAVAFANRAFGRDAVASVEPVDTMSLLPRDTEYIEQV